MLCAGIWAAGQMNVDRLVERQSRVEVFDQRQPVPFGVAKREFATHVSGAGDDAATDRASGGFQAERLYRRDGLPEPRSRDVRDQQILPYRQPQRAGSETL